MDKAVDDCRKCWPGTCTCKKEAKVSKSALAPGYGDPPLQKKKARLEELDKQIRKEEKRTVVGKEGREVLLNLYREWRKLFKEIRDS